MSSDREEQNNSTSNAESAINSAEGYELELAKARELHRASLPLSNPVIGGYEIAGFNAPSEFVGGDYYDFLPYKDGRLGIVIADVASKGSTAAWLSAMLKREIGSLVEIGADPASAMTVLNCVVYNTESSGLFATLIFGVLTRESGLFRYCNAGHNSGVLVRADGTIDLVEASGTVVGIFESPMEWELDDAILEPGDTLMLVTDGIVEALNREDTEFGNERVSSAAITLPRCGR
jgi:phosphoserine phosphatase RsbU/P